MLAKWPKHSFIFQTWIKHFPFIPSLTYVKGNVTVPLMVIKTRDPIISVALSHDGTRIVSGSHNNSIQVWDASTGAELQKLNGHTQGVKSVVFSHDGTQIVSGSNDNSVRVWDASTGVELQQLNGHSQGVSSVAFSHNGTHIVSGSYDNSVRVWNVSTDAEPQQSNSHTNCLNSVAFSYDGTQIISGLHDQSICICSRPQNVLWTSTIDGWIVSLPSQDRLVWMPQGICEVIHHPYNTLVISQKGYAHINFNVCNLGTKWAECYKPVLV